MPSFPVERCQRQSIVKKDREHTFLMGIFCMRDLVKVSADAFLGVCVDLGQLWERGAYELSNDAVCLGIYTTTF